jgi:hypothetical protein
MYKLHLKIVCHPVVHVGQAQKKEALRLPPAVARRSFPATGNGALSRRPESG